MRFLVTRPQPDCRSTADKLRAAGHVADEAPVLVFRPDPPDKFDLSQVSALALTSRRAVDVLTAHSQVQDLRKLPVFTVGDKTAAACRQAGFSEVLSAAGDVSALTQLILERRDKLDGGTVLYPVAQERTGSLESDLGQNGVSCNAPVVYRMDQAEELPSGVINVLRSNSYDGALVFSKRTAATFFQLLKSHRLDHIFSSLTIYCISRQAAEPLSDYMKVHVADAPCEKSLLDLTLAEC
ncbi:uroporphyrinogen-III synthase [Roseibium sp. SCPC15]|jgi:uroporphyrinogen-III synthase|uniref:uroporphyrinogen-III synthase n=1 Tax=Roseibium sp. SCP15 TaxID=3141376 RepID=UPI003337DD9C